MYKFSKLQPYFIGEYYGKNILKKAIWANFSEKLEIAAKLYLMKLQQMDTLKILDFKIGGNYHEKTLSFKKNYYHYR